MTVKTLLAIFALCSLGARAEPLADVLARMDRSARDFHSLTAKMHRVQFTAVLGESNSMEGLMRLRRAKGGTVGVVEFQPPDPRTVFVNGKDIQIYYPKANSVEIYDASKYVSNIDQFLLLGFGTTSAGLMKSYDAKLGGVETISGKMCTRVDLTPLSAEMKRLIAKIELWIPESDGNPVREKVTEPSKNYELVDYSEIQLNPALPDAAFELRLPAGVKKIYPQK
ncbi:MAG TPA: outer membrane lipoprotein carrier protein LolA [Bryobacteraceae bacterium]|nr:outer membrane lipoprotein carrier protein LolA [Bryobacteraceae bacterium]